MKLLYTTLFLSVLLGVASCGNPTEERIADNKPAVAVSVATVNSDHNSPFLTASGTVDAVNSATLSTRMMGFVDNIHVQVGQKVSTIPICLQNKPKPTLELWRHRLHIPMPKKTISAFRIYSTITVLPIKNSTICERITTWQKRDWKLPDR